MGAGGIGVDVSIFLTHSEETLEEWKSHWGVGDPRIDRGGLTAPKARTPEREVALLQLKTTPIGNGRARRPAGRIAHTLSSPAFTWQTGSNTTGSTTPACSSPWMARAQVLDVDHVVICSQQRSVRDPYETLDAAGRGGSAHGAAAVPLVAGAISFFACWGT
jgi:2,4-dienoyl-CoA reductase (NADPH2)